MFGEFTDPLAFIGVWFLASVCFGGVLALITGGRPRG